MIIILCSFLFLCSRVKSEESNIYGTIGKVVAQCVSQVEVTKCFKIQALKVANRALQIKNIPIWDGVSIVNVKRGAKSSSRSLNLNDTKLQKLDTEQLDDLLSETSSK